MVKIQPQGTQQDQMIRVVNDAADCSNITTDFFSFQGRPASLAIAFVSPYLDFASTIAKLRKYSGETPLIAVSTCGELCATQHEETLYEPCTPIAPRIIVQAYSPDLIAQTFIHSSSLYTGDAARNITRRQRISAIMNDLKSAEPDFRISAHDTLALTFFEGLTLCGDDFIEAVYETGRFPCLFAGGSAGTTPDGKHTYLFDGRRVLENSAVVIFLKMAQGKRFSVLKSQNFRKTSMSFIAVDTDPETGIVSTLLDPTTDTVMPATAALASALGCGQEDIEPMLKSFSFGIELEGEIFVRSVSRVNLDTEDVHFYSCIYQGDELFIVRPTDFVRQTEQDVSAFLKDKPKPLGVILNDCTMRRLNNLDTVDFIRNQWPCPVAGFSTLGELLGININQTLTAIAFFEDTQPSFPDSFTDYFPIHYAKFQDFFRLAHLRRIEVSTRLRADMTRRLGSHLGASPELAQHIEGMLDHSGNLQESLESIRRTIAREVATMNRAQEAEENLRDAIEAMSEGFILYDMNHGQIMTNSHLKSMFHDGDKIFKAGRTFRDIVMDIAQTPPFGFTGDELQEFVDEWVQRHENPTGKPKVLKLKDGTWTSTRLYRTREGCLVGIHTDITEIKKHENELDELQRSYELLLKTAGDGILGITPDGLISFANPAAEKMLHCTAGTMEGKSYKNLLGIDCLPNLLGNDTVPTSGECSCRRQNGAEFTVEYSLTPAFDEDVLSGAVLVFRDISLRKTYENSIANQQKVLEQLVQERTRKLSQEIAARIKIDNALQRSQQRLLGITNSLLVGVLLIDSSGQIVFANPASHRWLNQNILLERHINEIFRQEIDGVAVDFEHSQFADVLRTGQILLNDDASFILRDEERFPAAFSAALLDEGRHHQLIVMTLRGTKILKDAQREAMQASRLASVGQLATGIAHEINTPIQYIGDNLRFIEDTFEDIVHAVKSFAQKAPKDEAQELLKRHNIQFLLDEYPHAIGQALQGVDHVGHIVRSMKDFSHPGTSAMVCMDINKAVESTLTVSHNEWKQLAEVHRDLSPDVGKIQCFAADLNQVLLNLIVNAAHAIEEKIGQTGQTNKGNIYVATTNDGTWVEIRITDDGNGVPKHLHEQIFAPFFTTKPIGKGTGQGLSICQDIIVKKHDGQLFLDDTITQGASFVIRLPARACI